MRIWILFNPLPWCPSTWLRHSFEAWIPSEINLLSSKWWDVLHSLFNMWNLLDLLSKNGCKFDGLRLLFLVILIYLLLCPFVFHLSYNWIKMTYWNKVLHLRFFWENPCSCRRFIQKCNKTSHVSNISSLILMMI